MSVLSKHLTRVWYVDCTRCASHATTATAHRSDAVARFYADGWRTNGNDLHCPACAKE